MADNFITTFYKYAIPSRNIVIEIKEEKIKNTQALKSFIDLYRKHDFFIAIDDFGTGYSSFDRLEFIQPDIVKVDRSLIYNVHNNFINSEILSAISNMCHKIGAMVLAEGVEHRDEVIKCIKKEIDIFQGFWFSKPEDKISEEKMLEIEKSTRYIGLKHKENINALIEKKKETLRELSGVNTKSYIHFGKRGNRKHREDRRYNRTE
jgi:EAL domain-containing protein (putative c-di-GMP-specific phosphodiesterase class I)